MLNIFIAFLFTDTFTLHIFLIVATVLRSTKKQVKFYYFFR
jgi:hypothetical protein